MPIPTKEPKQISPRMKLSSIQSRVRCRVRWIGSIKKARVKKPTRTGPRIAKDKFYNSLASSAKSKDSKGKAITRLLKFARPNKRIINSNNGKQLPGPASSEE